jgi:hypothetical protein
LILDSVLWVYYANFPALFYPCDLMRRFGCNPPVGILVDTQLVSIVKRTLSAADYREFHGEASARFDDLRSFVESRPLLSDLEIVESYDNAREPMPQSPWEAFGRTMAHLRGMKEMMAWSQVKDEPVDDTATLPVHSLSWWTKVKKGTK